MHKIWLFFIGFALVIGCGPAATEPTTTPEPVQPTATVAAAAEEQADEASTLDDDPFVDLEQTAEAGETATVEAVESIPTATPSPLPEPTSTPVVDTSSFPFEPATTVEEASVERAGERAKGASADDALVTIFEYSDLQCPACRAMSPILQQLVDEYPDEVRVVYRHFPLENIHPLANLAAQAAEAAGDQDQFWAYHDALFASQDDWTGMKEDEVIVYFTDLADGLGLDLAPFTAALEDGRYSSLVAAQFQEAANLEFASTPSMIVNGFPVTGGNVPFEYGPWAQFVESLIAERESEAVLADLESRQYASAPEMFIEVDRSYLATITMASGAQFVIELLPQSAPQTVNSFIFLAQEGWFDGVTFHRVIPGFVAQTGDPSGTGRGGPGYMLPNEIDPDLSHDGEGVVAMANSGPDTNGSQWYITYDATEFLDGSYTIFGRIQSGMDVVRSITPRDPSQNPNSPPGDVIESVEITEG